MAVFPTLDFTQIKARYPKGIKKITEWIFAQPELQSVTEDFVDNRNPEASKEMFTGLLIQMDPRKLYDIFDSLNIIVSVDYDPQMNQWFHWVHILNTLDVSNAGAAPSRHTAEVTALHDAFEILEKQL